MFRCCHDLLLSQPIVEQLVTGSFKGDLDMSKQVEKSKKKFFWKVTCNKCGHKFKSGRSEKYIGRIKCPSCGSKESLSLR